MASQSPDITHRLLRHMQLAKNMRDLIAQCETLRDGGRMDEAQQLFKRVETLHAQLRELEGP